MRGVGAGLIIAIVVIIAVVLGVFLYMGMLGSHSSSEKPKIGIGDLVRVDVGGGRVVVRLVSASDKAYVVDVKVEGCVSKTYHDVVVDSMSIKDLTISIPSQKIIQGCTLKVYVIYNGEVIASKTFYVKP